MMYDIPKTPGYREPPWNPWRAPSAFGDVTAMGPRIDLVTFQSRCRLIVPNLGEIEIWLPNRGQNPDQTNIPTPSGNGTNWHGLVRASGLSQKTPARAGLNTVGGLPSNRDALALRDQIGRASCRER